MISHKFGERKTKVALEHCNSTVLIHEDKHMFMINCI